MTSPLADLSGDFVKHCTIMEAVEVIDAAGEPVQTWQVVYQREDLSCSISRGDGSTTGERVVGNAKYTFNPLKVTLFDSYEDITTKHRAYVDGVTYDIVDVYRDVLGYSTVLQVVSVC